MAVLSRARAVAEEGWKGCVLHEPTRIRPGASKAWNVEGSTGGPVHTAVQVRCGRSAWRGGPGPVRVISIT